MPTPMIGAQPREAAHLIAAMLAKKERDGLEYWDIAFATGINRHTVARWKKFPPKRMSHYHAAALEAWLNS